MTHIETFRNEPILELRRAPDRQKLLDGLKELDPQLPIRVPVWIGEDRRDGDELPSTDPGEPDRLVATAAKATAGDAAEAVARAEAAFPAWAHTPVERRSEILVRAAAILRGRRPVLTALAVRECAKPWGEADGDVCEAIDFLEYYARGAIDLQAAGPPLIEPPGERNELRYYPRGVCAVIAPWNFPIAIPLGMTAAALATGNTVVLKPAEQAPGCGYELTRALREAGLPPDALQLLPGEGDVGAALVEDHRIATIAFTGSGAVGLKIIESAGRMRPGQKHLKRVVAEMGGKNCVIVDSDADLDDAVPALVDSAFVYAGQKCSAADRVLVHEAIADQLIQRVAGAVATLQVGQADTFGTDVPPVIERESQERVQRYAEQFDGHVVARQDDVPDRGWFVAPTAAAHLDPDTPVLREEVFGPLLTVEAVRDVDDALARIDQLTYALTSGLFCRNPRTVDEVARRNPVGNLYVNRRITGAMVGRQPFGGNRLSGTGTKAGGPDYLLQFVEPRVVSENTVRHGLVVE
ncbi:MAG TPA: aldehyde dehydrogenase family protein [Solirubrobacteraceae bacterium]|jgi:RHH-type proline utilization regulon transcriptional repressor/proline dehydrogenase/delta 1-pyrroline-5-carboxylate dehydrogenase|nr:aldehyde dehydrogenase family protein [Solirubrobacteraceae bacterium]